MTPQSPSTAPPVFGWDKPWLAPLAGYSDLPFRMLCRHLGAAVCETEMISAKGLFYKNSRTGELLLSDPGDQPLVAQLFGADPLVMADAARLLRQSGYLHLDCNFGCSVRKVFRQGAGAALLADPERALAIARELIKVAHADDGLPRGMAGFKMRFGVDAGRPALPDLALRLEDAGADWITVHPRYARDGFSGRADWDFLRKLAPRLSIPLLASGDLLSARAGLDCLAQTGVTGVMYARGALYNPAIFASHLALAANGAEGGFSRADLRGIIDMHIYFSRKFGAEKRAFVKMRSLVPRYVHYFPGVGRLRSDLCKTTNWDELGAVLDNFFEDA